MQLIKPIPLSFDCSFVLSFNQGFIKLIIKNPNSLLPFGLQDIRPLRRIMEHNLKNTFRVLLFMLFVYSSGAESTTSKPTFKPTKYLLEIITNEDHFKNGDSNRMRFDGTVTVDFKMDKPQSFNKDFEIVLNTNPSGTVKDHILQGNPSTNAQFKNNTKCGLTQKNDKLVLACKAEDLVFQTFKLQVTFSNPFGNDMTGFYRSSYVDSANNTRWLLTTHFEPIFARKAFPCFDQPDLKAEFEVYLTVPQSIKTVLSNTPLAVKEIKGNMNVWKFKSTGIPMSTYLVAFTASDFEKTTSEEFVSDYNTPGSKRQLTTYGREEIIKAGDGKFAQAAGLEALNGLTKYLGIGYAFEKVDQVGIPDFSAGAMENWGHISFREKSLFVNESKSTTSTKQSNLLTITHELVHQWFGNLVTLESWDYIWLNEAFATYIEYIIASKFEKIKTADWKLMEQLVVNEIHQRAFETDGLASSKSLSNKITDESLIFSSFNDIPYSKGAAVLRMWDLALKDNSFQKSLQFYLKDRKEKSTNPENLYKAFNDVAKMDSKFFSTWTLQPGYPVVEVKKINGSYHLNQTRFFWESQNDSSIWHIPITNSTETSKNFNTLPTLWLGKDPVKFNATGKWIIVNNQQAGYYRVNYDKENWIALSEALKESNYSGIPEINRAQILNDVFSLARSLQKNYVEYSTALKLARYLKNETSFIPWKTALNAFDFLFTKMNDHAKFKEYILEMIKPHFKGLNFTNENHIEKLKNADMSRWSCSLGLESCVKQARDLFNDSSYQKYPDTQEIVLCTVVKNMKEAWNKVFDLYKKEGDSGLKIMYISALGCSQNKTQIEEFLNKTITDTTEIRNQDFIYVLQSVYNGNTKNIDIALNFVKLNFKKIAQYYGGINPLGRAVVGIAKRLTTGEQVKKLDELVKNIQTTPEGKPAMESLQNAMKIANSNVKWMNERQGQFNAYFTGAGSYFSYSLSLILLCLISVIRF